MPILPSIPAIYTITCLVNGLFYIGSTNNLRRRWNLHCSQLRRCVHDNAYLQNAWNKYGETDFVCEILERVKSTELQSREQHWIDLLQPFGTHGFNIAKSVVASMEGRTHSIEARRKISEKLKGRVVSEDTKEKLRQANIGKPNGMSGRKHTPESCAKMSATRMGMFSPKKGKSLSQETKEKMRIASLGRKASDETKAKMSLTRKGRPVSENVKNAAREAHSKNYIVLSPEGTEYMIRNLKKFCKEYSLLYASMLKIAQGIIKTHKGWTCKLIETAP